MKKEIIIFYTFLLILLKHKNVYFNKHGLTFVI